MLESRNKHESLCLELLHLLSYWLDTNKTVWPMFLTMADFLDNNGSECILFCYKDSAVYKVGNWGCVISEYFEQWMLDCYDRINLIKL